MRVGGVAAGLAAAIFFMRTAAAEPPPVEAFGTLPLAEIGRISPDGKHLAVIQPLNGRNGIVIYDLSKTDSQPHSVTLEGAVAQNAFWKTNDRLICVFQANLKQKGSSDINAWTRAISVDANGQDAVLLLQGMALVNVNTGAAIVDLAPDDPWHVYMAAWETNAEMNGHAALRFDQYYLNLFKVNVKLGYTELVQHGTAHTAGYLMDGHGQALGRIEEDADLKNRVFLGHKEIMSFDAHGGSPLEFEGLTAGPNPTLAVLTGDPGGIKGLYSWTSAGKGDALFLDSKFDVSGSLEDERTGRIIGAVYRDDVPHHVYFDPAMQHVQKVLEAAFPGQAVWIASRDDAGAAYVIRTEGPKNPPVLSLYTTANHQVNIVQESYPSLKQSDLGEVRPYPYKARDGLDIHAYLTLPHAKEPHNLPLVVFPHGGPESRDGMNFNWWTQFMASRGYAVFQPNYRGSSGYGWNFVKAGDGEWTGKVQDDLQDGVQKLIADGIADPKRICIVGGSWGGYLALVGATFSPEEYACAISYAGPSDLDHNLYTGTTFESENVSVWKRSLGA